MRDKDRISCSRIVQQKITHVIAMGMGTGTMVYQVSIRKRVSVCIGNMALSLLAKSCYG